MSIDAQLRVDGVWLGASGLPYGDLSWTDRADGGNFEASWLMELAYGERPAPFFKGAKVEIYVGLVRRWYGQLSGLGWDDGSFTATGISQRAYDFVARSPLNQTTSVPDVAIDASITFDGWAIARTSSFSGTAVVTGDVTDDLSTVGAVLDQSVLLGGIRWGVWGDGVIRSYSAPTLFDYVAAPGVIELGETTEDAFTRVIARYVDSSTGQRSIAYGESGVKPDVHTLQDLTNLGPISNATAMGIAQNLIALGASSPGWSNSAEVSSAQLLTPGGLPAELATVTAGQMVRVTVVGDHGQSYRDLVIGETKYVAGSDVLSLSPVGKVASNLSDVIEDAYTRITGQPVSA